MKTVCILLQNYYGDDVRVRRKAEALVAAGYGVDVIALRDGSSSETSNIDGVKVYTFPLGKKRGSLFRYLFEYTAFFLLSFFKLTLLMRKRHYSIVDVNNLPDFLVFAAVCAKSKGAKIVFDMHEITPEFYISKYGVRPNSQLVRLLKYVEKSSMHFADHVITINEPIQQLLIERGLAPERSTVIMNSVDETLFASSVRKPPALISTALVPQPFMMMYHGTLTSLYGLDIAISAFGKAKDLMREAEFWILGCGPEKNNLERLADEVGLHSRVKFLGKVPLDQVPQWLSRCDLGVLATRRNVFLDFSFSNKLPEYIIMKKPVISSRLRTIRHYFSENALAYFEPNDPEDLARQMIRLYGDAQLRARFARRALEEYQPVRWEVMKERYLQLIASLLADESPMSENARSEAFARAN